MSHAEFTVNGDQFPIDLSNPHQTLLDWLREECKLTGTKEGCNEGDCGACTVMVTDRFGGKTRRRAVNACIQFMPQLIGTEVCTVEGLAKTDSNLHPVQTAMINNHGSQCGFCTPGIVMSLATAHTNQDRNHNDILAGNLCRCTGYEPIIKAAEEASSKPIPDWLNKQQDSHSNNSLSIRSPQIFVSNNVDEFAEWYADNPTALIIAGATDVGLWVTKKLIEPKLVCFINNIEELAKIDVYDDWINVGAATNLTRLKETMDQIYPRFGELLRRFGSVQVRNSATIGGNIANGSPIGDAAPALIALDAELTLRHRNNLRRISLESFFLDYGKQDRQPGEFVETIHIPVQPDNLHCYKLSKRFDQDISAVCGCFNIFVKNNKIESARIAFGGMAATPKRALNAEQALTGQLWCRTTIDHAMKKMNDDYAPISDVRASSHYRMTTARNMLLKTYLISNESTEARFHVI